MNKFRAIIVEDDIALNRSLTDWLAPIYLVSSFESAREFLKSLNYFNFQDSIPTCILLDYQMPEMNGIELQRALKNMNAQYPIIFMSGNVQQVDIIEAWRGGAVDFLLKPFSGEDLSKCLEKLFSQLDQLKLNQNPIEKNIGLIDIPISHREAEVLLLLGQGRRQAEVAQILGIGLRTIKMHRTSLKNKLNLNTPVELSRFCDQHLDTIQKLIGKADINK